MPTPALTLANYLQVAISAYSLNLCYHAIQNARTYEEPTEKAAKQSQLAADQLYQTRVTLGSSTATVLYSLLTAGLGLFTGDAGPSIGRVPILTAVNVAALVAARRHNEGFWAAKPRIPGITNWNAAVNSATEIRVWMRYLMIVSALRVVLGAWDGYKSG